MNSLSRQELDRLLFALLDDVITAEEYRVLQDTLLASEAARDRYLELNALHNLLELVAQAPLVVTMPKPLSVRGRTNQPLPRRPAFTKPKRLSGNRSITTQQGRRSMRRRASTLMSSAVRSRPLLATAAVLVLAAILLGWKLVSTPPMARVASSRGSVFAISHPKGLKRPPKENTLGPGSSVELTQGTVELTFSSGVRGVFQAPETITLTDEQHLTLKRGAAWFHVPPKAVGFEVLTPQLQIVDLGTEFGVVSRPDGADEIHVLTGKVVAAVRKGAAARETLVAGESRSVSPDGGLSKIDTKPELFLTTLPATLPYLHWGFDELDLNRLVTDGSHPAAGHVRNTLVSPGNAAFDSITGKFGNALASPGKNGYVESDWPGIEGAGPRTVAYWLKVPPGQKCHHPVVGWGDRNNHRSFFSYIRTDLQGTVTGVSSDLFWVEGSKPINDGQWHHLAMVYTGKSKPDGDPEIYSYIDGMLEQTKRYESDTATREGGRAPRDSHGNIVVDTAISGPQAVPLTLFTHLWSDRKQGHEIALSIDELYVFEAALSGTQVVNLFQYNRYETENSPAGNTR